MTDHPESEFDLADLRDRLDAIDDAIIDLAAERQNIVSAISDYKLKTSAPLRHYEREAEVIARGTARAESLGLDSNPRGGGAGAVRSSCARGSPR